MSLQLLIVATIFTALAIYSPRIFDALAPRAGRPHRHLILIFRLWFALLAVATVVLLVHPPHPGR